MLLRSPRPPNTFEEGIKNTSKPNQNDFKVVGALGIALHVDSLTKNHVFASQVPRRTKTDAVPCDNDTWSKRLVDPGYFSFDQLCLAFSMVF